MMRKDLEYGGEIFMNRYSSQAGTGLKIEARRGQEITAIDVDGGQVADFFAELKGTVRQ